MQAINGYLEEGRFIPNELVKLPKRIQAILVYSEAELDSSSAETTQAKAWREFFDTANASDEIVPEAFEKLNFKRRVEL